MSESWQCVRVRLPEAALYFRM